MPLFKTNLYIISITLFSEEIFINDISFGSFRDMDVYVF